MEAIYAFRGTADRYAQYVFAPYLSIMGPEEERIAHRENSSKWTSEAVCGKGQPWPLIQYLRWTLVEDSNLHKRLANSIVHCTSTGSGATVDLICLTLELTMGITKLATPFTKELLDRLEKELPAAKAQIQLVRRVSQDGRKGLVERVLAFNYR